MDTQNNYTFIFGQYLKRILVKEHIDCLSLTFELHNVRVTVRSVIGSIDPRARRLHTIVISMVMESNSMLVGWYSYYCRYVTRYEAEV